MYISYILHLSILKAMTSISVSQNPGICSNVSNGEPLECCPNYGLVGTSCEECLAGSRGVDCADDCAKGFYGRLCRESCSCDPCDKVYGCQNMSYGYKYSTTADTQNDDTLPEILRYNPLQRLSTVETSSATGKEIVYPINSCQTMDPFVMTKANRTEDFQDVYGHIDQMEGCYNILKLKVLDEKDVVFVSKACSTPQNENNYMKTENNVSATTSIVSNSSNADELMSKKLIKREKRKHQRDFFRTLYSFKQKDTNERKRLRYSFVKSTELI